MKRALPTLLDTIHSLALAVWLGGLVAFWLVFAQAGAGITPALLQVMQMRLGSWIEIAGLVMIGSQFLLRRRYQSNRQAFVADGVRQLLTFAALLLAELPRYSRPLSAMTVTGSGLLLTLAVLQMLLLVGTAALTVWLQAPRLSSLTPDPSPGLRERGRKRQVTK